MDTKRDLPSPATDPAPAPMPLGYQIILCLIGCTVLLYAFFNREKHDPKEIEAEKPMTTVTIPISPSWNVGAPASYPDAYRSAFCFRNKALPDESMCRITWAQCDDARRAYHQEFASNRQPVDATACAAAPHPYCFLTTLTNGTTGVGCQLTMTDCRHNQDKVRQMGGVQKITACEQL